MHVCESQRHKDTKKGGFFVSLCLCGSLLAMTLESGCHRHNKTAENADPEPGVSLGLASERAQSIEALSYDLSFTIPAVPAEPIYGKATIRFSTKDVTRPLVLDFTPGADHIGSVSVGGRPSHFRLVKDHIIIPNSELASEDNVVEIDFRAGDASLNRSADFMYTLFVPARAHLAFPCFDQPNLKARFALELTVPEDWQAVSNGAETFHEKAGNRVRIRYAETQPIPTYLFAFAAGKFQVETAERNGRWYRMFHRETDAKKVARNKKAVFDLHASSLEWLEKYTAIPYRFGKFDFVLIPSFQFGGMEHPGSIFYNEARILLDESATETQMLNRAETIAHETAHMWFGDLVTMQWFNDVWMKEVFAQFMAAKIVDPAFPKVNHDLRFLVAYYPPAYSVDRTAGTHPIRQELANLDEAGSLYGAIIYDKAPIVVRQLERILGPDRLQEGLRAYLKQFQFGNATWLDLVRILGEQTKVDVSAWSRAWVEEAGRPSIRTVTGADHIAFVQADPLPGRFLRWTERMEVLLGAGQTFASIPVELQNERTEVPLPPHSSPAEFVLPTGGGLAYGDFTLDDGTRSFLLQYLPEFKDALTRGAAWVTLWEEMLDRRVRPSDFVSLAVASLEREDTEQNARLIMNYLDDAFWKFLPDSARRQIAPKLESVLRAGVDRATTSTMKSTYFSAFHSTVTTPGGIAFLERVWRREQKIPGLVLSEPDEATMALELAVRSVPAASAILEEQRGRFMNPDRKARFEFVMPALSDHQETRDQWFGRLSNVENRRREPWVTEGLRYLNHPLRAGQSEKYLRPSLELLRDIQRTGDIFFPKDWMDATLYGHNTRSAADTVRAFLASQKDYPIRLHRIILQSADELFRAAETGGN
jgi:aminopeptidase N